jgi:hypothetical protein
MKCHRVVLSQKIADRVQTLSIDFGWWVPGQVQSSITQLRLLYPGWNLVRHFAISQEEMHNGRDHKTVIPKP